MEYEDMILDFAMTKKNLASIENRVEEASQFFPCGRHLPGLESGNGSPPLQHI